MLPVSVLKVLGNLTPEEAMLGSGIYLCYGLFKQYSRAQADKYHDAVFDARVLIAKRKAQLVHSEFTQ